ncbi:zinc finger protein 75A-like [Drosophila subobscura]|uniref:zinc finger protein 75A-like n=1 Tax=Drosophila subobscura TaxID=7241 RepID=UPI00155A9500|nr:zinc finger protein 75A-like [Drosophila subobscura]
MAEQNLPLVESESQGLMGVCMSLGLSLVLEYIQQSESNEPQSLPQDAKKARYSAPLSVEHPRNQLRENQMVRFHKCLFCPEVFASRYDRNTHQKTHQEKENVPQFNCDWKRCNRSFETELSLWRHQRSLGHHRWTATCWRCKRAYPNLKTQMAHTKSKRCYEEY